MKNQPPNLTQDVQKEIEYMALRIAEKFSIDRYALEKELKYYAMNSGTFIKEIEPDIDPDDIEIEVTNYEITYKGERLSRY